VNIANRAAEIAQAAARPPSKVGTRSKPRSSIGSAWRRSRMKKTASSKALAASEPTTVAEPQSCSSTRAAG
jgi:hypothetical protein